MNGESDKRKMRVLTFNQTVAAGIWFSKRQAELEELTLDEAAERATEGLGFEVSKSSVRKLYESAGFNFVVRRTQPGKRSGKGYNNPKTLPKNRVRGLANMLRNVITKLEDDLSVDLLSDLDDRTLEKLCNNSVLTEEEYASFDSDGNLRESKGTDNEKESQEDQGV